VSGAQTRSKFQENQLADGSGEGRAIGATSGVSSEYELKQRIIESVNDLNRDPVIHRWRYKIDLPA
jgi:hypothetical protein